MGRPIAMTRTAHSASDLRGLAARAKDGEVVRRLLALSMVLEGHSRAAAARMNGMDRQTLCDWVHRYNAEDVPGLMSRVGAGPAPLLSETQMAGLHELVLNGPDPAIDDVIRWRCVDLRDKVAGLYGVFVDTRTVAKWLGKMKMARLQPRRYHPKKDAAAQEAFKKFRALSLDALPACAADKTIEVGFQDEACVGQKGSLEYIWAPIGSRPAMVRDSRHDSVHLFGAICPARRIGAAIIMPAVNTKAMNEHLAEISTQVAPSAHALLVCDGAGWHQRGSRLIVPGNITRLPLPPYAPELNPMENVWDYLRGNKFSSLVWGTYDAIVEACRRAWLFLTDDPDRIASIGTRQWAYVRG